ncbi:right-handed parallel beta-helix repeat-containing protein [Lacibacter sp.]|uniref:right-handed parallel beta-helix repeat-containing protein n=1 Tax=Lacibacter sp. TaxID=1915409 RepID=UPI002B4B46FF|nr:right-handed parallel beta-helix repeat-containing protein [Lacibacter sp.]HLP38198.1 right-handed parallel beta-helix repeat-containing protein [Lacibacter sp.]
MRTIRLSAYLFFLSFCFFMNAYGKNYYLSENGDDNNNGLTPKYAWKTLTRTKSLILKPGDSLLLERGSRFEGELIIQQSGKPGKPIVVAAYGQGSVPIITGAVQLTASTDTTAKTFSLITKAFAFFVNDVWQQPARYPNSGYLKVGKGFEKKGFETNGILPEGWYTGSIIRMRTIDWVFENRTIADVKNNVALMDVESRYKFSPGYGYFLEGKSEFLDSAGEWNQKNSTIQWLSSSSSMQSAEACIYKNGITLSGESRFITIANIQIEKFDQYGLFIPTGSSDITVTDCRFRQIEKTGVFADTLTSNLLIKNSHFEDIHGRGISAVRTSNSRFVQNTLHRIGIRPGYGLSGVNGMIAIVIENDEQNQSVSNSHHNYIGYNIVDSNGYAGIRMDGSQSICEYNIVKNSSLKLNDAGAIYCFAKAKNRTYGNIIRNNLVINVTGNIEATPDNPYMANGIYLDNNSTDIVVENNTIMHVVSSGIIVNDNAQRITIRNNQIFDASVGIGFSEWARKDSLYGCVINRNTVTVTNKTQKPVSLLTYMGPELNPGTFDSNSYVNAHDGFVVEKRTDPNKFSRRRDELKLQEWQRISGQDQNSTSLERKSPLVFYNDTHSNKTIKITEGQYVYIDGTPVTGDILLQPCGSVLLFKSATDNK